MKKEKIMRLSRKIFCTAGIVILLSGTKLFAEGQTAKEILNKAYQYIGSMDKYAFDAVVVDAYTLNDKVKKVKHRFSVKVDRPGKLRVDVNGDTVNRSNYINNGSFTMLDHDYEYYGQLQTPKSIDGALDFILEKYGINAPLASLIYSNMGQRMKFRTSKNFGKMNVDGVECDYVAFKDKEKEAHVWIASGDKPFIKSYSLIDNTDEEQIRINTSLSWKTGSKINDTDFVFIAPEGVSKISIESAN
jgi:hypothetical protein